MHLQNDRMGKNIRHESVSLSREMSYSTLDCAFPLEQVVLLGVYGNTLRVDTYVIPFLFAKRLIHTPRSGCF